MSEIRITKDNFQNVVLNSNVPVLVDFWASWCGPCRMLGPTVSEIAEENPDIKVGKVNVDEEPELAAMFGIASIPTVVVFNDGKAVNGTVGAVPKGELMALVNGARRTAAASADTGECGPNGCSVAGHRAKIG